MTAAGRLWRRAPLWRASLLCAVLTTAAAIAGAGRGAQPAAIVSAFKPMTPADVLGAAQRNVFDFANRTIPLPAGDWHPIIRSIEKGKIPFLRVMLVRMAAGQPNGFLLVQATQPGSSMSGVHVNYRCHGNPGLPSAILPPRTGITEECWNFQPELLPDDWGAPTANELHHHALATFREAGIRLSGRTLGMNWFQSGEDGLLLVDYFFPTAAAATAADIGRLKTWGNAWIPLLEDGAGKSLSESAVEDSAARRLE